MISSKLDEARAAWQHCIDLGVDVSAPIEACIKALLECVEEQAHQIQILKNITWLHRVDNMELDNLK